MVRFFLEHRFRQACTTGDRLGSTGASDSGARCSPFVFIGRRAANQTPADRTRNSQRDERLTAIQRPSEAFPPQARRNRDVQAVRLKPELITHCEKFNARSARQAKHQEHPAIRNTIVGAIDDNGRLPGAIASAAPCTGPNMLGTPGT